jgi:hypothetical protein
MPLRFPPDNPEWILDRYNSAKKEGNLHFCRLPSCDNSPVKLPQPDHYLLYTQEVEIDQDPDHQDPGHYPGQEGQATHRIPPNGLEVRTNP